MKEILTAEESYLKSTGCFIYHTDIKKAMIEFAKLHVEACKEEIKGKVKLKYKSMYHKELSTGVIIDKQSIEDTYPLNLIK